MADFALPALVVAAATLLGRSGGSHVVHRRALRTLLDRQALLPSPLRPIVADGLGPVELTLALVTTGAVVAATAGAATVETAVVGGAVAVLGAAFVVLVIVLARIRPATPCGCGGVTDRDDRGVGPLDGLRAVLVLAGGLALLGGAVARLGELDAVEVATVLVAGAALAAVTDLAARLQPSTLETSGLTASARGAGS